MSNVDRRQLADLITIAGGIPVGADAHTAVFADPRADLLGSIT